MQFAPTVAIFPQLQSSQWQSSHSGNLPSGNLPTVAIFPLAIFPQWQSSQWHLPSVNLPSGNLPSGNLPRTPRYFLTSVLLDSTDRDFLTQLRYSLTSVLLDSTSIIIVRYLHAITYKLHFGICELNFGIFSLLLHL